MIERLLPRPACDTLPDAETCSWLAAINDKLADRLAKVGLIEPRQPKVAATVTKLDAFLADYLATRSDLKPSTRFNLELTRRSLVTYFRG